VRILVENYGDVKILSDRPFGYKRYHVVWSDKSSQMYSGLWYKESKVREIVEETLSTIQETK